MAIEIKITCNECDRTIQLDDVTYCFECVEKLKIKIQELLAKQKENENPL